MTARPLILVSNDDGIDAQGINVLTLLMRPLGDVVVVAPDGPRSGAACSMTVTQPVTLSPQSHADGLVRVACSGTPADCVKLALEHVMNSKPALMVSGINHGDNASVNVHYSGTMGAVFEACMKGIPAIGFSLRTRETQCDFTPYGQAITRIAQHVLQNGLPQDTCLNVNFPKVDRLMGIRVCRMARGKWDTEWTPADRPGSFKLTGQYTCLEPDAQDTDWWAMDHGMGAVVPLHLDMTHVPAMTTLHSLATEL
ncbi:MAG: 5'/3'-nucleotidase SurE [Bacteroidaceae bacterium]